MSRYCAQDLYAAGTGVYDFFYPDRAQECDFWKSLAGRESCCILDLMSGTGEVGLALAQDGHRVLGFDRSPSMLTVASHRLAANAIYLARGLALACADATALPIVSNSVDVVLVGGSGSFNHLTDEQMLSTLCEVRRVLVAGGRLGLELVNPFLLDKLEAQRSFGPLRPVPPGLSLERTVFNRWRPDAKKLEIRQVTTWHSTGQRMQCTESFSLNIRSAEEIHEMLTAAGFGAPQFWGDHAWHAYDEWSSDLIVLACNCI